MSQNPYVFLVGCARSGTTLLHRILDAHPQIAITPEMHWVTNFKHYDSGRNGQVSQQTLLLLSQHKRFSQLEVSRLAFENLVTPEETISYAELLTRILELLRVCKGKALVGNKTPTYVLRIKTLHQLYPEARFVHLIRDGRDVCLSVLNWKKGERIVGRHSTWAKDPVSTTALWWRQRVRLGQEAGRQLPSHLYHEIRYEKLVSDPEKECRVLCDFLRLPFDDHTLRFYEGRTRKQSDLGSKRSWLPVTPGLRDWRAQMSIEVLERFEAAAGDLLGELGYEQRFPIPNHEVRVHAAAIYESFTQQIRSRGQRLPKVW